MFNIPIDELICRVITLIIAFTVHEFAHAWMADHFGDPTAREAGRLTLNPLVHLDFFGSLLLIVAGFGWARPTPINPELLKQHSRFGVLWVSVAGPLSNLVMAAVSALPIRLGLVKVTLSGSFLPTLGEFLYVFATLNIVLAIFNLIPLPPLDGEKIVTAFLPESAEQFYNKIRPFGVYLMLAIVLIGPRLGFDVIGWILTPAVHGLQHVFLGV
jgi:Zn-dependent protease